MICYDLVCGTGHAFDGWFRDIAAFDTQSQALLVSCPVCGSTTVSKAIMAPMLGGRAEHPSPSTAVSASTFATPPADPRMAAMIEVMRKMKKHIEANSENVGEHFAEEARKMHYNEIEKRDIYGAASAEDAQALAEEGIQIQALPWLPEDAN